MKNKLMLTVAAALGLAFAAEAQTVSVGPRVGVNFATMRAVGGSDESREASNEVAKSITGAQFGVVANFSINDMFSIQPELLYSQKGTKIDFAEGSESLKSELKKNYLEVPVLGKLAFGTDKVQGFVTAGPYAGYWLSGKSKWDYKGTDYEYKGEGKYEFSDGERGNFKDNRLDLGASIGVGAAYRVGTGAINLDVRYGHGFSDRFKYEGDRGDDPQKSTNRVIGVSLAYLFGAK